MKLFLTILIFVAFTMQANGQNTSEINNNHPNVHKILIKEVLQTGSYTYLQAEENGKLQWLAIPKMEASIGDTYYFQGGMEMVDFKSKELDRIFSSVLFLNGVISPDVVEGGKTVLTQSSQKTITKEKEGPDVKINPAVGGISIEELFANKEKYANKVVKIRGKVTKYNPGIMNRNWIHLQDGTSSNGEFDLTATSAQETSVGDVITIEGIITLDKDFGAGYFYNIILENGKITD